MLLLADLCSAALNKCCSCCCCCCCCRSELQNLVKNVSTEANLPLVDGDQLDFSMKLFDLNQVGTVKFTERGIQYST
jgi:hypothetical protein